MIIQFQNGVGLLHKSSDGFDIRSVIILMIYILWRNVDIDKYELLQNCCYIVLSDSPSNFYLKDF